MLIEALCGNCFFFLALISFKIVSVAFKTDSGCFFDFDFKAFSTLCFGYRYKNITTFFVLIRKQEVKKELEDSLINGEH